jgi:hypothetical protein
MSEHPCPAQGARVVLTGLVHRLRGPEARAQAGHERGRPERDPGHGGAGWDRLWQPGFRECG